MEALSTYPSNSLSIAPEHTETKAAMVDGWIPPLTTSLIMESVIPHLILTLQETKSARVKVERIQLVTMLILMDALICSMLLALDQFQLPLMPPTGHPTNQESSTTATRTSTTEFFWLELLTTTGKSKTLGELHGEIKASLDSKMLKTA